MRCRILTFLAIGIATAAFMSYGCGGAGPVEEGEELTSSLFIAGSIGDPTPIVGVYRDAYAEGGASGESEGDTIYDFVGLSCEFLPPSVEGGAVVEVVEGGYELCTSRNTCLTFTRTAGPYCTIAIDATFRQETPNLVDSWIEIPVQTTVTLRTSMESDDGQVVVEFDSEDWADAFVLDDVLDPISVDTTSCDTAGLGILELGLDEFWVENNFTPTNFIQGYQIVTTQPTDHGEDYYCECPATVDMVGKVPLTDILLGPVSSTGTVHFAAMLCDDDDDENCRIGLHWTH